MAIANSGLRDSAIVSRQQSIAPERDAFLNGRV
jgi:hypothetical protein